jgi:hypothetical protein
VESSGTIQTLRALARHGDELVAVGDGGILLRSLDGRRRTSDSSPTDEELFAIAVGARGFVAVAVVEAIAISVDGRSWTTVRAAN